MTIDIIGAGIGGLTTAIALEQKGFKIRIFEQAEKIKPVGAGIILANNAMQVFDKLGLKKILTENGNPVSAIKITNSNLEVISEINLTQFEQKYNVKNIAIHRGSLQQILFEQLKTTEIYLGHKLNKVVKNEGGHMLHFENGKKIQSTTIIGSDGLHSKVRTNLFPHQPIRFANQLCWRGIANHNLPTELKNELNEAWGKNERFGFVQIAENKVYWYALKTYKNAQHKQEINEIEKSFANVNSTINNLITATPKEQINLAEISDFKPTKNWYQENVCLIGDAAHAATPNMGQGACQAIEDAYILSECLGKHKTNEAFETFRNLRLKKAHSVVKTSWTLGKVAHLSNPVLVALRNQMLRMTPKSISTKQSQQLFQLAQV